MDYSDVKIEELSSWEIIGSPSGLSPIQLVRRYPSTMSSSPTMTGKVDVEMVVRNDDDKCSVFPPSDHEGLEITDEDENQVRSSPSSSTSTMVNGAYSSKQMYLEITDEDEKEHQSSPSSSASSVAVASSKQRNSDGLQHLESSFQVQSPHSTGGCEIIRRQIMNYICNLSRRISSKLWSSIIYSVRFMSFTWVCALVSVLIASSAFAKTVKMEKVANEQNGNLVHIIREKDQKISHLLLQIAEMNEKLLAKRRATVVRIY